MPAERGGGSIKINLIKSDRPVELHLLSPRLQQPSSLFWDPECWVVKPQQASS